MSTSSASPRPTEALPDATVGSQKRPAREDGGASVFVGLARATKAVGTPEFYEMAASCVADMDGIELQVYGHLLDQFWSPLTNDLVGPYGADTLENRLRFPLDVLGAIRKRVGDDFIVGFRYTADEAQKGGITPEEGLEISKILAATGQLDFLNVIRGRVHTDPAMIV